MLFRRPTGVSVGTQTMGEKTSLTYDLSRIVLLGIAFDVSRYITREVLCALSSRVNNNNVTRGGIGKEMVSVAYYYGAMKNIISNLASAAVDKVNRIGMTFNLDKLKEDLCETLCDKKLFSWIYSLWGNGPDNNNYCNEPTPRAGIGNESIERRLRSDSLRSTITECTQTMDDQQGITTKEERKYLEILVHNVSHTDLILGLSSGNCEGRMNSDIASLPFNPFELHNNNNAEPKAKTDERDEKYIMCRPRFSTFDMFSRRVLSELQSQIKCVPTEEELKSSSSVSGRRHPLFQRIMNYPRYERSSKTARYTLVTPRPSDQYMLPVGFNLERVDDEGNSSNTSIDPCEMQNLRLRGRDIAKVDRNLLGETPRRYTTIPSNHPLNEQTSIHTPTTNRTNRQEALRINAVFFPLLATLLPRWLGKIADKFGGATCETKIVSAPLHTPNVKKVIVLVSGVGTPRNWTHSMNGNSTQTCAELMELFIQVLYPDITVVRIHSETNIFRYDENITFATQELMPMIDAYRDAHARSEPYPDEKNVATRTIEHNPFNPDWRQSVSVTYSFADGSAARSHAIQAALRPYRPTYFHFWQLKTFWHESKITDEDIEVHSFEEMETVPAMAVDQTPDTVVMVVKEMKAFRECYLETLKRENDVESFWLRKSKQPVLAVLLVQKQAGKFVLYRGTNMEVSMPTGSLCAERNAIGNALANDPGLKREDLLMVAVLSIQLPGSQVKKILPPPGMPLCRPVSSGKDGIDFAKDVAEKLKQHQIQGESVGRRSLSSSSFAGIAEERPPSDSSEEWEIDAFQSDNVRLSPMSSPFVSGKEYLNMSGGALIPDLSLARSSELDLPSSLPGDSTPQRRISLYQNKIRGNKGENMQRQKVLVQPLQDMNPLKPCGACNEWLKKIAQSNPHFKVLTFTDDQCNGVYISPCEE